MHQFTGKLLILLATLLLGLSPLQGATIILSDSLEWQDNVLQESIALAASEADSTDIDVDEVCNRCQDNQGCFSQYCSSVQCAACAVALSEVIPISTNPTATRAILQIDAGVARLPGNSLFRPPRI